MRPIDADKLLEKKTVPLGLRCEVVSVNDINNTPTINPESLRQKGEWIMKETMIRSPYAKNAYCSECLEETSYNHNFCPNCGADMRGEAE